LLSAQNNGQYDAYAANAYADNAYDKHGSYEGYDPTYSYDPNSNVISWATALYSYEAQQEGELSFNEGDVIGITAEHEDGWSSGVFNGLEGAFPSNYVQKDPNQYNYDNDQYAEPQTNQTNTNQQLSAEVLQRRKENREKLKGEMKDLKESLAKQTELRQQLEKDVRELTEKKQRLKKELRNLKADMSDKNTLFFDLLKLSQSIELFNEFVEEMKSVSSTASEALAQFSGEFQKEAKSSAALTPWNQKLAPRSKEVKDLMDLYNSQIDECVKSSKEFSPDLEHLIKALSNPKLGASIRG